MRFTLYLQDALPRLAVQHHGLWFDSADLGPGCPASIEELTLAGAAVQDRILSAIASKRPAPVDLDGKTLLPPVSAHARIFCIGLNYADHASESSMEKPTYPVVFLRTWESFVGHGQALDLPKLSGAFDYEGELVAIIGRGGRHIQAHDAHEHIAGYSIGNDGSVRDYQLKRGSQWTLGKNFDRSGAIGPVFVTADELPALAKGLAIATRLNGQVVQSSNTSYMIFDLAQIIACLSEAVALKPGDVILSGTPAGVGAARTPPLFMKVGDVVEVEIERLGVLRNHVAAEPARTEESS